ncbi:hypothetical protein FHG87_005514 [Trinorchestia longiramus]|nr:hypothetical protein FHG87_005514 [Trinorchestia longiramus]
MGKVRHQRKKYHAPAVGTSQTASNNDQGDALSAAISTSSKDVTLNDIRPDLFATTQIDLRHKLETQSLACSEMDTMSMVSMRSTKSSCREGKKLERRKERRQYLLERLQLRKRLDDEAAAQRKRQRTAVVGDMRLLTNALPSLERLQSLAEIQKEKENAKKNSKKQSNLQKKLVDDLSTFLAIAQHKEYQKDMFNLVGVSVQERLRRSAAGEEEA